MTGSLFIYISFTVNVFDIGQALDIHTDRRSAGWARTTRTRPATARIHANSATKVTCLSSNIIDYSGPEMKPRLFR